MPARKKQDLPSIQERSIHEGPIVGVKLIEDDVRGRRGPRTNTNLVRRAERLSTLDEGKLRSPPLEHDQFPIEDAA